MNIQRFHAATSREALAKARMAFGEGTLILSNRPTALGVEVVATAEDAIPALDQAATRATQAPMVAAQPQVLPETRVEEDAEQLAMSTLSFQDYVRERMLRRRHAALNGQPDEPEAPLPALMPRAKAGGAISAPSSALAKSLHTTPAVPQGIVSELQSMKEMIEERFNTLAWLGQARQDPIQLNLMLKLIRAGYSPALSRMLIEHLPEEMGAAEAVRWLMDVLARNLRTDAGRRQLHHEGGIFALVGATGVGKTTTVAKLAAQCASHYGANSVGLITLDTYRVAGHEQLRAYGRMLGVVAHQAHDRTALQDLLNLLSGKKMILIDTNGLAPSDPRKRDLMDLLDLPHIHRLLVLNAGSHGDTIDDTLNSFKTGPVPEAVLSKVDEAVKLGPAVDALIRHQVLLRGVTNGQRVPEDWEAADPVKLVGQSMRSSAATAFEPKAADLNFFFAPSSMAASERPNA